MKQSSYTSLRYGTYVLVMHHANDQTFTTFSSFVPYTRGANFFVCGTQRSVWYLLSMDRENGQQLDEGDPSNSRQIDSLQSRLPVVIQYG